MELLSSSCFFPQSYPCFHDLHMLFFRPSQVKYLKHEREVKYLKLVISVFGAQYLSGQIERFNLSLTMWNLFTGWFSFFFSPLSNPPFIYWAHLFSTLTSRFPLYPSSSSPPSNQMLQRSLKQRRPTRQMQWQRPPSPRMTKAKSTLKRAESYEETQKQKS